MQFIFFVCTSEFYFAVLSFYLTWQFFWVWSLGKWTNIVGEGIMCNSSALLLIHILPETLKSGHRTLMLLVFGWYHFLQVKSKLISPVSFDHLLTITHCWQQITLWSFRSLAHYITSFPVLVTHNLITASSASFPSGFPKNPAVISLYPYWSVVACIHRLAR